MPELRRREQTLQAELEMLRTQVADQATYLRLAQTLSTFLQSLRANAKTLDMRDRQRITRLLVKEVVVGDDSITIRHSIPNAVGSSGGNHGSSNSTRIADGGKSHKSFPLRPWSERPALRRTFIPLLHHAVHHDPRVEVAPYQPQHGCVNDPLRQAVHQHVVIDPIERPLDRLPTTSTIIPPK